MSISYRMIGCSLLALVFGAGGLGVAHGRPGDPSHRTLSGIIIRIDRDERTIVVRDPTTGRETVVAIPDGQTLRLRDGAAPTGLARRIPFELAMRGMYVEMSVTSIEASEP